MNGIDAVLITLWSPALRLMLQEKALRFFTGHCTHVSTLCLPDKFPIPSPSIFAYTASDQRLQVGMRRTYYSNPPVQGPAL